MCPIVRLRQKSPSSMILMFLLVLVDLGHLLDLLNRQICLDFHKNGLQLLHLLVRERERVRARNASRERLHSRSPSPEPQLIPILLSDGEDDPPPQDGSQRPRSTSRDRAHAHAQAPQLPQILFVVIQEPVTVSDEDFLNPSSTSAGLSP